mmetsp:Transcript_48098/g.126563  ORF Transcript_48098/g.126563 Transcript_48098/m.126563 type:complete len:333 (-) Transcript_48098:55-1053(-)
MRRRLRSRLCRRLCRHALLHLLRCQRHRLAGCSQHDKKGAPRHRPIRHGDLASLAVLRVLEGDALTREDIRRAVDLDDNIVAAAVLARASAARCVGTLPVDGRRSRVSRREEDVELLLRDDIQAILLRGAAVLPLSLPCGLALLVLGVESDSIHGALLAPARRAVVAADHGSPAAFRLRLGARRPDLVLLEPTDRRGQDQLLLALSLEDDEVLVVDKGDAVDRAALDRLHHDLRVVLALREDARPPGVRVHVEGVPRDGRAVRAPDALHFVHVGEPQLRRLSVLVEVELQVRRDAGVLYDLILRLLDAAKERLHQPFIGVGVVTADHHRCRV